ncbi:MAG: hypothetical protein ACK5Q1_09370 [Limnobacter sp.]
MHKFKLSVLTSGMALLIGACGGGSSSGPGTSSSSVSGGASKGPLNGATVCAYQLTPTGKGDLVPATGSNASNGCVSTGADGLYNLNLGNTFSGSLLIEATGGQYCSTEIQVAAGACASGMLLNQTTPFTSVVEISRAGTTVNSAVNTLTTAALTNALMTGALTASAFGTSFTALTNNLGLSGINPESTPTNNTALATFLTNLAAFVAEGNSLDTAIDMVEMGQAPQPSTPAPVEPEPPAETDELSILQSLEGSYTLKAQDSDALCYGWGFPVGPGNPDPYFTLTVAENGTVNLRPHDISRNGNVATNPPVSVSYSPSGTETTLSIVRRSSQTPVNRFLRLRKTGDFTLDFELEESASTLRNFTPQSAAERSIQLFVNSGSCTDLFKLIPEVPLFYPTSAQDIPVALQGAKSMVFNEPPVTGAIPDSPYLDGVSVAINVGQQTLTIGEEVLSNPGFTNSTDRSQYIFRSAAGVWFVLYDDNQGFRINVYGNANPFTEGTTFFGQLQLPAS